ncbi:MAG: hypothetical protein IJN39_00440, partial [Clostridia bacterium]|nr:hypothetical protein [Clostridia bacterium]
ANPMQAVQDYLLSEDEEMLERRAIPTLAEFLTRPDLHFNPRLIGYGSTTGWQKAPKEPDNIGSPKNGYNTNVVAGLYEMTGGNVPFFYELGLEKGKGTVANAYGNIAPFVNNLNMYIYTGEKSYLDEAVAQADTYLSDTVYAEEGIMGQMPGWINFIYHGGYYPNFSSLLDIYEITKDQKYLDAAEYVAQMILTALWVPGIQGDRKNELIEVNNFETMGYRDASTKDWPQTEKSATPWHGEEIWRVGYDAKTDPLGELSKAKIQPSMVERWIPERVGLGLEQSSTFENGSCNITMNYWAGDFMRLAGYTGETMFSDAARNAIIGRFGTYSGYYQTDYITAQQFTKYPFEGPEVTGVYWHHIPPFLAMLEDFLFGQTQLWSGNNIVFPSIREQGYAYFSSKQFGHAPGKFFEHEGMWPWLAENTIDSGNLQIDWLAARKDGLMGVALMNESDESVTTTVSLLEGIPGGTTYTGLANVYEKDGSVSTVNVNAGKFEITIPGKTLRAVTIAIPEVKAPAFAKNSYKLDGNTELGGTVTNHVDGRGYVLQISPENYFTYVYVTAVPADAKGLEMTYTVGGKTETVTTNTYPYEFITKVDDPNAEFTYTLNLIGNDGSKTDMGTCTLMTRALSEAKGVKYTGEVPKTKPSVANVEVEYKGSKTKFEPFDFAYSRHGYSDTNFKFIVKESVFQNIGTSATELVGLPLGGSFTVSGMTKQMITVITGVEPHSEGIAVLVSEVPGVTTNSYPT